MRDQNAAFLGEKIEQPLLCGNQFIDLQGLAVEIVSDIALLSRIADVNPIVSNELFRHTLLAGGTGHFSFSVVTKMGTDRYVV